LLSLQECPVVDTGQEGGQQPNSEQKADEMHVSPAIANAM